MKKQTTFALNLQRQSGISLLMALVLLAGIMLVGVLTYSVSNTQYKLSGNQQFQAAALNEAEAALSVAEAWLIQGGINPTANRYNAAFEKGCPLKSNTAGLYRYFFTDPILNDKCPVGETRVHPVPREAPFDPTVAANWEGTNAVQISPTQQYIIQKINHNVCKRGNNRDALGKCVGGGTNVYRVIARGTNPKGAQRIIETTMVLDIAD